MENQKSVLVSPIGTRIKGTLERLTGCARIVPESVREDVLGGFEFDYEGTTDLHWEEQHTVIQEDERVFLDENGDEFLEGELWLVSEEEAERMREAGTRKLPPVITVTMDGGLVQSVEGIPRGLTVLVINLDVEGSDPERLVTLPDGRQAHVRQWSADPGESS